MTESWFSFSPALGGPDDARELAETVAALAEASELVDPAQRLDAIDQIRRPLIEAGGRCRSSANIQACTLVLADLVAHGWRCRSGPGVVEVAKPTLGADSAAERERVRRQLHVERDRQLQTAPVREFISRMEQRRFHRGRWTSIYSLMRNGRELAEQLRRIHDSKQLGEIARPYLQAIQDDETCEQTGLALRDIWRYFRHTWATQYRSVPGRSLMFLVRDAAAVGHPVIGLIALASSAVQIGVRDEWIGWSAEPFVERLRNSGTEQDVTWLLALIDGALKELYLDDLLDPAASPLTRQKLRRPSSAVIEWLEAEATRRRAEHQRLAASAEHKRAASAANKSSDDRWLSQAETPLFRSKRASQLAVLLRARSTLGTGRQPVTATDLRTKLDAPEVRRALQSLVLRAKSERVGVAIADIAVCGAIPPYSALLGGKLVAMLAASPEAVAAYRQRYAATESVIASSLAGRPVVRPADLVFLGTTSLYGVEPTQYTRLRFPCERGGGRVGESVGYRLLGRTEGYGTLQFGEETVKALSTLVSRSEGGQRVNSIFGEGVSPRLRKIREGLDRLGLPSDLMLSHGSSRLVYGVPLARNFREYLLGLDSRPDYLLPMTDPAATTARIAEWWFERWVSGRIVREDVLREVERHRLTYPVRHGARVPDAASDGLQRRLFANDIREGQ
jgi:hypothetical protein